jgi:hypothetical protein
MSNPKLSKFAILLSFFVLAGCIKTSFSQAPGDALNFVLANKQYVDCGNNSSLQITGKNITLEAWINVSAWNSYYWLEPIISKAQNSSLGGYELRCGGSPTPQVSFNLGMGQWAEIVSPGNELTLNRWYHVCGTYDGQKMILYINGNQVASQLQTANIVNSTYDMLIGANSDYLEQNPSSYFRYFSGEIDEVRIWNIARTQDQIRANMYNVLTPGSEPNLVAYYKMDNGSGTLLTDSKGTNTGTLTHGIGGSNPTWVESYAMVVPVPLTATGILGTKFTANWAAPAIGTITSYKLDVSTSSTFGSFVGSYNNYDCSTNLSQQVTGLTSGTTYYYRVRADKTSVTGTGANYYTYITAIPAKANQTISFSAPSSKYLSDPPYTISATASSGLTVSFSSSNTSVATVSGTTVTLAGTGTCNILANQSGNADYNAAPQVSQPLTVSRELKTWTGVNDHDWNNSANWNPTGIPDQSFDVAISQSSHNPIVIQSGSSPAICNDLTINNNAIVTIAPGKSLTVNGILTNSAGNSGLLIQSDATGTGSLIHQTDGVPSTVQRYIMGSPILTTSKYHFVSIPNQINSPTSNLFLGSFLYDLDPSQQDATNNNYYGKWINLGNLTTTPLNLNQGYMIYYPDASITYTFTGNLNNGDFNYSMIGHTGNYTFNLVPNPYPSAINWGVAAGWTKSTGIGGSAYIWSASTGNYITIPSTSDNYIPIGQSFIVMAYNETSPSLKVKNAARVHNNQAFYKSGNTLYDQLVINADANNYADITTIAFTPDGTTGFDLPIDGIKMYGMDDAPQLYTISDNQKYSLNNLPYSSSVVTIPLNFELKADKPVTLTFSGIESFSPTTTIFLEDKLVNTTINLRQVNSYSFDHSKNNDPGRFLLHFHGVSLVQDLITSKDKMWIYNNKVYINAPDITGQNATLEFFNTLGQCLETINLKQSLQDIQSVAFGFHEAGWVIVRLTSGNKLLTCRGFLN